jgi:exopolysaccharide biosynthesis polyprenyl glycosylphosphotransferase
MAHITQSGSQQSDTETKGRIFPDDIGGIYLETGSGLPNPGHSSIIETALEGEAARVPRCPQPRIQGGLDLQDTSVSGISTPETNRSRLSSGTVSRTDTAKGETPRTRIADIKTATTVKENLAWDQWVARAIRRIALTASSQTGASLLSMAVLAAILQFEGESGPWIWQSLIGLGIGRVLYFHTRGPKPVLQLYSVCKRVNRLLVDETAIAIGLTALAFVMSWPVGRVTLGLFVAGNLTTQLCLMSFSRLVIKVLTSHDRLGGRSSTIATQQALIVGTGSHAKKVADMVLNSPELETRLIGFLDYRLKGLWRYHDVPLVGHPDALEDIVANTQVDALFWAVEPLDIPRAWSVLKTAEKMGVRVFVMPSVYDPKVARIQPSFINGMPAMVYRSDPAGQLSLLAKSTMDRVGAVIGLLVFAPVMLVVTALVKCTSRGPILFRQVRSGRNGKQFELYKFRTMCTDAEVRKAELMDRNEMSGPVFKISRDPRVTTVGRILRKYSIDELPQFFNVLKGEMSIVGPRPPLPSEVSRYEPWQHRKLSVKPGLTCLWQVNGRNNIDFEEWMRLDLKYIDNWSIWLDLKIILKTVPAVMSGSGQ